MFNAGERPAVDSGLSVSRVGSAAQVKAMKQVSGSLKLELAQFREMEAFAKFGSDLDAATAEVLSHGNRLTKLLIQKQYSPMPMAEEVLALFTGKYKYLKNVPVDKVQDYEEKMLLFMKANHPEILSEIADKKELSDDLISRIKEALDQFTSEYLIKEGA